MLEAIEVNFELSLWIIMKLKNLYLSGRVTLSGYIGKISMMYM